MSTLQKYQLNNVQRQKLRTLAALARRRMERTGIKIRETSPVYEAELLAKGQHEKLPRPLLRERYEQIVRALGGEP